MSHALKPAPDKAIFRISEDFSQLMLLREIMAYEGEDTAAIDGEIANYFARDVTREKIDTVIGFLRYAESQEDVARAESYRLRQLADSWDSKIAFLKDTARAVLENSGQKALEGSTAGKLVLKGNGGKQALEITNAGVIPEEFCEYVGKISGAAWKLLGKIMIYARPMSEGWFGRDDVKMERVPNNERIRAELEKLCETCYGVGKVEDRGWIECPACEGSQKRHVPGARLLERGSHVEIK